MPGKLEQIARQFVSGDPASKSLRCYSEYDRYFYINGVNPVSILEVGVHLGVSTKVLSLGFASAYSGARCAHTTHRILRFRQCELHAVRPA